LFHGIQHIEGEREMWKVLQKRSMGNQLVHRRLDKALGLKSNSLGLCSSLLRRVVVARLHAGRSALGLAALICVTLASCGGGGGATSGSGGTSSVSQSPLPLTPATDFNSFVSAVTAEYQPARDFFNSNLPTALQPGAWTSAISSVSAAMAITKNNPNPIQGKYENFAVVNWPNGNAYLQFSGANSGAMAYSAFDTTNQSIGNGGAQAFVGIFPGVTQYGPLSANSAQMLTSILIEAIITDANGTVEYRALQAFIGYLVGGISQWPLMSQLSGSFANQSQVLNPLGTLVLGPIPNGIIGHLFAGEYYEVVLECYIPQCSTGLVLQYSTWLQSST
jgi:hypothetical protein